MSEPKGRGAAWTEERGTSDEERRHLKSAPEASEHGIIRLIAIRDTELSVDEVRAAVADPAAGGIALFAGAVRDSDHDRAVTGLSYTAHPSAEAELRRVAEMVAEKFPAVTGIAAVHRLGDLAIGDLAVVAAVSCPHRSEAFEACRELIDVLKSSVPIWKHQRFTDGTAEWVGTP